jgi:AcrB/AcrD/AcrF family
MSGAVERVRPKMMTVCAIMAGLLPIMWSHGTGAEVMQRIAVPMIGGMVSSTLLTLIVIRAIYTVVKGAASGRHVWRHPCSKRDLWNAFTTNDTMTLTPSTRSCHFWSPSIGASSR